MQTVKNVLNERCWRNATAAAAAANYMQVIYR